MTFTCTRCEKRFEKGYRNRSVGVTLCVDCLRDLIAIALPIDQKRVKVYNSAGEITEWDLLPDKE